MYKESRVRNQSADGAVLIIQCSVVRWDVAATRLKQQVGFPSKDSSCTHPDNKVDIVQLTLQLNAIYRLWTMCSTQYTPMQSMCSTQYTPSVVPLEPPSCIPASPGNTTTYSHSISSAWDSISQSAHSRIRFEACLSSIRQQRASHSLLGGWARAHLDCWMLWYRYLKLFACCLVLASLRFLGRWRRVRQQWPVTTYTHWVAGEETHWVAGEGHTLGGWYRLKGQ